MKWEVRLDNRALTFANALCAMSRQIMIDGKRDSGWPTLFGLAFFGAHGLNSARNPVFEPRQITFLLAVLPNALEQASAFGELTPMFSLNRM